MTRVEKIVEQIENDLVKQCGLTANWIDLASYTRHADKCEWWGAIPRTICDCGLADLLDSLATEPRTNTRETGHTRMATKSDQSNLCKWCEQCIAEETYGPPINSSHWYHTGTNLVWCAFLPDTSVRADSDRSPHGQASQFDLAWDAAVRMKRGCIKAFEREIARQAQFGMYPSAEDFKVALEWAPLAPKEPSVPSEYQRGVQAACDAICPYCRSDWPLEFELGANTWIHREMGAWRVCAAEAARALLTEEQDTEQ